MELLLESFEVFGIRSWKLEVANYFLEGLMSHVVVVRLKVKGRHNSHLSSPSHHGTAGRRTKQIFHNRSHHNRTRTNLTPPNSFFGFSFGALSITSYLLLVLLAGIAYT